MKHILLILFFSAVHFLGYAQVDTTAVDSTYIDSSGTAASFNLNQPKVTVKTTIDTALNKFLRNPFVIEQSPIYRIVNWRQRESKDQLFYLATGLLLALGFLRVTFSKYSANIFRLFFQPTFRQKQTREQLVQNSLPSLLFNLLFILSGATYISLLANHFNVLSQNLWWIFLYSAAVLSVVYVIKLLFLQFSGWLFNVKEATSTYIFIVYLINKIIGILLIPFIIVIGFSNVEVTSIAITVSLLTVALLFMYRYLISYAPVRTEIKVSPIHFFFYIIAFEIVPLLVIYKLLMIYMARSV